MKFVVAVVVLLFLISVLAEETGEIKLTPKQIEQMEDAAIDFKEGGARRPKDINRDFREGRYLIFDCRTKNFACVDKDSDVLCSQMRAKALTDGSGMLVCASLKKFLDLSDCLKELYKQIHRPSRHQFCFNQVSNSK